MREKFVVIYGMNNLGKTTATEGTIRLLSERGLKVEYLKYPIYDLAPTGPRINRYLREKNPEGLTPEEAQMVFAQNRRDFEPQLVEKLARVDVLLAEDYRRTTSIWGMIYGVPLSRCEEMNEGLRAEDLGILLDGERFTTGVEKNHLHEQRDDWNRGRQICLELAKRYDWKVLKANQSREEVARNLTEVIISSILR